MHAAAAAIKMLHFLCNCGYVRNRLRDFVVKVRHVVFFAVSQTIGAIRPSPVTTPVAAATPQQMYSRLNASKIQLISLCFFFFLMRGAAIIDLIDHV